MWVCIRELWAALPPQALSTSRSRTGCSWNVLSEAVSAIQLESYQGFGSSRSCAPSSTAVRDAMCSKASFSAMTRFPRDVVRQRPELGSTAEP
jgi:hypothetical protein